MGRATKLAGGQRVIDAEWVQLNLARVHAKAEFLKLLNWRIAAEAASPGPAAASATKVFGTEFAIEAYRLLMEVLGANAQVRDGPGALLSGRIERMHRSALILTFGGGTNEVQRDIIAAAGLGLPVARRRNQMDFTQNESQRELAALSRRILADRLTPERLAAAEAAGDRFDPALWAGLAEAGVLAAALPESRGRRRARPAGAVLGPDRARPGGGPGRPTWPRSCSARARWPRSAPRTSSAGGRRPRGAAS